MHVDDHLIVVDKPAGLLSVPGRGVRRQDCVSARVQARHADALVVHRLDQATSGLLLMARGLAAQRALGAAFEARQVDKRYLAVVAGLVAEDEGCIDLPLMADWPNRPLQKVDPLHGRPAVTHYRVLARDALAGNTRLALTPVTGRSHQLRVHLQALGHPILGDALYAPAPVQALAPRLLLHAAEIGLLHPASGAPMRFETLAAF